MDTTLLIAIILIGVVVVTSCIVFVVWRQQKEVKTVKKTTIVERPAEGRGGGPAPSVYHNPLPPQPTYREGKNTVTLDTPVPGGSRAPDNGYSAPLVSQKTVGFDQAAFGGVKSVVRSHNDADPIHLKMLMVYDLPELDITLMAQAVPIDSAGQTVGREGFWEMASTFDTRLVWNTTRDLRTRRCDCHGVKIDFITVRDDVYATTIIPSSSLVVGKRLNVDIRTVDGNVIVASMVNVPPPDIRRVIYLMKLPGDLDPQTGLTDRTKGIAEEMKLRLHDVVAEFKELTMVDKIITGPTVSGVQVAFITLSTLLGNCKELGVSRYAKLATDFRPTSTNAFVETINERTDEIYRGEEGVASRYLSSFPIDATELGTSSEEHNDVNNMKQILNQVIYAPEKSVLLVLPPSVHYYFMHMFTSQLVPEHVKDEALAAPSFSLYKLGLDTEAALPIISINPLITAATHHRSVSRASPISSMQMMTPHPSNNTRSFNKPLPYQPMPSPGPSFREQEIARRELEIGGREVAVLMRERELEKLGMGTGRGRGSGRSWY